MVIKLFSDGFKVTRKQERFRITFNNRKPIEIAANKIYSIIVFGRGLFGSAALKLAATKNIAVVFATDDLNDFYFLEPDLNLGEKSLEIDILLTKQLLNKKESKIGHRIIQQYILNANKILENLTGHMYKSFDMLSSHNIVRYEDVYFQKLSKHVHVKTEILKRHIVTYRKLLAFEIIPLLVKMGVSASLSIFPLSMPITYPFAYQSILDIYPPLVDALVVNLHNEKKVKIGDPNTPILYPQHLAEFSRALEKVMQSSVTIEDGKMEMSIRKLVYLHVKGVISSITNPFAIYKPIPKEVLKSLKF